MEIYKQVTDDEFVSCSASRNWVQFKLECPEYSKDVRYTKQEAIAAARAILKHFNAKSEAPQ